MKTFLEYLGFAILISVVAVSCEYCGRHDKRQSVRDFVGACPTPESPVVQP